MSLRDWSSPYNEQGAVATKVAARKKVSIDQLNQLAEDDTLADFKPLQPRPDPPEQSPKLEEPVKETYPMLKDPYPQLAEESFTSPHQTDLSDQVQYMIRLLEEQRDEKTGHVTEEIILYLFLGIFVIFVVDTFVKTGRYSR